MSRGHINRLGHRHGRNHFGTREVSFVFDEDWNGKSGPPLSTGWVHAVGTDPTVIFYQDLDLSGAWGPLGWGQVISVKNSGTDINRFDYDIGAIVQPSFVSVEFSPTAVSQGAFDDDAGSFAIRDNVNSRNVTGVITARQENIDAGNDVWVENTGTGLDWWHGIGDPRAFRLECTNFNFAAETFDLRIYEIFPSGDPDQLVYTDLDHAFQNAGLDRIDSFRFVSFSDDSVGTAVLNRVYIEGVEL